MVTTLIFLSAFAAGWFFGDASREEKFEREALKRKKAFIDFHGHFRWKGDED